MDKTPLGDLIDVNQISSKRRKYTTDQIKFFVDKKMIDYTDLLKSTTLRNILMYDFHEAFKYLIDKGELIPNAELLDTVINFRSPDAFYEAVILSKKFNAKKELPKSKMLPVVAEDKEFAKIMDKLKLGSFSKFLDL